MCVYIYKNTYIKKNLNCRYTKIRGIGEDKYAFKTKAVFSGGGLKGTTCGLRAA